MAHARARRRMAADRERYDTDDGTPRISFQIRRRYYDLVVAGVKRSEVRKASPYWMKHVTRLVEGYGRELPVSFVRCPIATFVCGRDVHRRHLVGIELRASGAEALGRELSGQGRADLGDGPVVVFNLGGPVE